MKGKKLLSLFLVLVLAFSFCTGALADTNAAGSMDGQVVILHTNDVHGALDGYAKVAAAKAAYEAEGAYVLLFDAGDYSQGTPYVSLSKGATAIELMNAAGYDAVALGNHEFDYGYEALKSNMSKADFKVLAANVKYNGAVAFEDNTVFTAPDGTKIGVFGLDTPETATKANPAMIKGVTFSAGDAMFAIAKAQVKALKDEGCDLIVCLGHLGVDDESAGNRSTDLLKQVSGIDLFIDAHSHSVIDGGDNKFETGGTMLVSTGTAFAYIGAVVYKDGKLSSSLVEVNDKLAVDASVKAAADAIVAKVKAEYDVKFATTEVLLNGDRDPGNRTEETNLGDLITDAIVWKAKEQGIEVDAAVTNGGGIRAAIAAGDITKEDINLVLPFGNTLAIVQVTGAELLEALEASTYCTPTAVGGFPQVSGIKFTIDATKSYDKGANYPGSTYAKPASIKRVTIDSVNGKPFSLTKTYTIVTNNFTAAGGDTYYAFAASPINYDLGIPLDEVVMEYISTKLNGNVTAAAYGKPDGEITVIKSVFTDIESTAWYYEYVNSAYELKLVDGVSDTEFAPGKIMNRATLATMLYRLEGKPAVTGKVSEVFTDCKDGAWYSDAVLWASQCGVVDGVGEGLFAPGATLTRQQMATMIYKYAQYNGAAKVSEIKLDFSDAAAIAGWAEEGVAYCVNEGIMDGTGGGMFSPASSANRAQGAKILCQLAA